MNEPAAAEGNRRPLALQRRYGRLRHALPATAAVAVLLMTGCGSSSTSAGANGAGAGGLMATAQSQVTEYYNIRTWATPTTGPKATAGKKVWWVSCGQQSPGCALDSAAAVEAGKAAGWEVTVFDGNFGLNDAYSKGVRQAIAANADGIILEDIECGTVKQALVEAQAAHIPVLNEQGPDCPGSPDLQSDFQYFPGFLHPLEYSYLSGQILGYKAVVESNGSANMLYYHILGNEGSQQVMKGLQNVLGQCSGCSFKEEDVPLAQLSPALAARVQSDLLGNPNANAVAFPFASVFDVGLGPGLVRANRKVQVLSPSESVSYYNSMRQDTGLDMSTLTTSSLQASWGAIDDMNRLLNGQPVVPQGGYIALTDLTHNLPAPGEDFDGPSNAQWFAAHFNYKAAYTKIWNG